MSQLILICGCLFLHSCFSNNVQSNHPVFPTYAGSEWNYVAGQNRLRITARTDTIVGGHKFAILEEEYKRSKGGPFVLTLLMRTDSLGNVVRAVNDNPGLRIPEAANSRRAFDWYRFDAQIGESWTAYTNSRLYPTMMVVPYKITLESKEDTVRVLGKPLLCLRFYIDEIGSDDGEYWDWVSPGTGLVKRTFGNLENLGYVLESRELPEER